MKRAIILDMDETLEHGISQSKYDIGKGLAMVLRPHLDELITKLQEAKQKGIDIILCTTARESWVERFFSLKPEFRSIFDKKYTRDNEEEWRELSEEEYPLEYKARNENINLEYLKPVTTFGYDAVLYIDDNKIEGVRLQILFGITHGKLEKDVTYFSGFGFNGGSIAWNEMLRYKEIAKKNIEFSKKLEEYIENEKNNPGCIMMCSAINKFMEKEFVAGLTLVDEQYTEDYNKFNQKILFLQKELQELSKNFKIETSCKRELKEHLNTDKKYPYEELFSKHVEVNNTRIINLGKLKIVSGDIIENSKDAEAIVNPANKYMDYGCGVCGAIYEAAGVEQIENYCHNKWIKDMEVNEIRVTTGFALLKDIIHIYAPIYYEEQEPIEKIRECYLKLFEVIKREEYKKVIIPSLGTGFHGYQHEDVAEIVINLLGDFCKNNEIEIIFNLYDDDTKQIYEQYIKR